MQNINEVIGIIKGISYDGIINDREINFLHSWVERNRHFATYLNQKKLIKLIDEALDDKVLTDLERRTILATAQNILEVQNDEYALYTEFNGIIEGIISDNEVNDEEILSLREWFELHSETITRDGESIRIAINKILENGVITTNEKASLLSLLKDKIESLKLDSKLLILKNLIKQRKNIGIELVDLLDREDNMSVIHSKAESVLRYTLNSYTGSLVTDPEIVVISLSLIAMLNYDGSFYDSVRGVYESLYTSYSEQKIEGLIRFVLNKYRSKIDQSSRSRIINYPLRQSVVPKYYLPNFFEFIFDIYKLNFEFNLSEDLYEEFKFVFDGLQLNLNTIGDDLEINATKKTYKLIQTTKDLIIKEKDFDPLINLSVMVIQLIDKYIWNKKLTIQNQYFQYGFEKWVSIFEKTDESRKERQSLNNRSRWKPKFYLQNDSIYLLPPIHRVQAHYNYWDLKIVVENDGEIIYENARPNIREIIGGYQINLDKIKVDKPLSGLRYLLMSNNEIIYDSTNQLHRDFIVFNQNGQEISNNTDYQGTALFCTKNSLFDVNEYYNTDDYVLSALQVKLGDTLSIENKIFNFTSLTKPGIFGEKYENHTLVQFDSKKEYPVYKTVKYLVFEDEIINCSYEIYINSKLYVLNDFQYTINSKEGANIYVINLNITKPNIYSIAVYRVYKEENMKVGVFNFLFDPELVVSSTKINDLNYKVTIDTGLLPYQIVENLNLGCFDVDDIQLEYLRKRYVYRIPLGFNAYRISNDSWKPFSEDLWINDIKHGTILELYGVDVNSVAIYSSKGVFLEEVEVKNKGIYKQLEIGFLNSYKEYDYTSIFLLKEGKAVHLIRCYNKCCIEDGGIEELFDPVTNEFTITTQFKGKGLIFYEVLNSENVKVFGGIPKKNSEKEVISGLNSFENYTIHILEKPKGLSFGKGTILKTINRIFYARKDFVGRNFKIDEVYFYENINRNLVEKVRKFRMNYVKFTEQIDESTFKGEIYAKSSKGIYWLYKINPVEIEVNSDVISGTMDLYITNEGDGLLIDLKHNNIMNNLDDFRAPCIEIYTVDANGKEEL